MSLPEDLDAPARTGQPGQCTSCLGCAVPVVQPDEQPRGLTFEQACDKLGFSGLQRRRYRRQMGFRWEGVKTVPVRKRGRK